MENSEILLAIPLSKELERIRKCALREKIVEVSFALTLLESQFKFEQYYRGCNGQSDYCILDPKRRGIGPEDGVQQNNDDNAAMQAHVQQTITKFTKSQKIGKGWVLGPKTTEPNELPYLELLGAQQPTRSLESETTRQRKAAKFYFFS